MCVVFSDEYEKTKALDISTQRLVAHRGVEPLLQE